jgi:hypothetical protein
MIKIKHLKRAKPESVIRLANWLKLRIDGMSNRQIIKLVNWRLSRYEKRLRGFTWY